jgi:hypothetical protein
MNGLAWFARQVPSEGFSDIGEGRVGEKEIPHSDQWIKPEQSTESKGSYRPDKYNKRQVMKGKNKQNETDIAIEEIYQSNEWEVCKYHHNATYNNGRYEYSYPNAFQMSRSVNKSIAVRRIESKARSYYLDFNLETANPAAEKNIQVNIPASFRIDQACEAISTEINSAFAASEVTFQIYYSPDDNRVRMSNYKLVDRARVPVQFKIHRVGENDDLLKLFNFPLKNKDAFYSPNSNYTLERVFTNVWNRETLFIHASFVTYTLSGYLGRDGEFYTQPSKIYPDDRQTYFTLHASLDGDHTVELPYENFIVELTFIIDSDDYMGM